MAKKKNGVDFTPHPPTEYDHESYDTEDEDSEKLNEFEKTCFDKFINYIFCRGDLAAQKLTTRPVPLAGLFRYTSRFDYALLALGTLGGIISGIFQPVLAIISGHVFSIFMEMDTSTEEFKTAAYVYVYIFIGIGLFISVVNFFQFWCFNHVCCRVTAKIRHHYIKAIVRQNAGWFDKNHCGTLTTQLNDNIERIREGVGDKLGLLIRGFSMFIAALIISFCYEWRLALFMSVVAPSSCAIMSSMSRKMGEYTSKELAEVGKAGAIAEESILGVRTVQAFNGQHEMVDRYRSELGKGGQHAITKSLWNGFLGGIFFFVLLSFMGAGFILGGHIYRMGYVTNSGDVLTVVMSMMIGAYFLGLISPHLMVLLNARVAAAVIYRTIDRKPRIDTYCPLGLQPASCEGRVEFRNVHFRYPTRRDVKVLHGLDLVIEPGETVALVGHSGCGKSTSVGLLTRLYEAESGKILLDGNDVRELNMGWLRNAVGIVQQEPLLFNDTIAENLRIGCPSISPSDMERVCRMANAHEFVMKLPKGYDTVIGDGGVQLSGGQKQRIAIARTLARNPRVLLLDEATSALDAQSESIVQSALDNAAAGRSTIVIAHRLSTVRNADKIVVLEKGNILEIGSHDELIEKGGRYAELVKAQQFQPEADPDIPEEDEEPDMSLPPQRPPRSRHTSLMEHVDGAEAFRRGSMANDSLRGSSRMGNSECCVETTESMAFARGVEEQMEQDSKIKRGLLSVYANATGMFWRIFFAILFACIRGFELPVLSVAFGLVFGAFQTGLTDQDQMMHELVIACIVYASIGLCTFIFQFASTTLFGQVAEELCIKFRCETFSNILHQDAAYFDNPRHSPGKLITRLATDAPNVKAIIDSRMMTVLFNLTAWVVCLVLTFVSCWPLGCLGLVLSSLLGGSMMILARLIENKSRELAKKDDAGRISIEIIENVRTIQLLTRESYFYLKYEASSKLQKRNQMYKGVLEAINFTLSQSFVFFAFGCGYALGIQLVYLGMFTSQEIYSSNISILLACFAIMNSTTFFPEFVKARSASGQLFNMIERQPKTGDHKQGERPAIRGNILFDNVHFVYPQRPHQPVMRGLHFTANKGQTIALVGPSGSGKSTIISLLERFYDGTGGAVRFDGMDVKRISQHHLRTQMALVGQEPRLFAGTIKSNIVFGLPAREVTDEKIQRALETANCRFVSSLPQGLDTEVGERGTQLSGGQKQRIAIARALVRDPTVLLLDEATSALDSESERAVQEALDRAREGRTCVTIAHRLSSIQNADVIVYVENGKVRESGSHSQLMQRKGRYYQLIKKQDLTS